MLISLKVRFVAKRVHSLFLRWGFKDVAFSTKAKWTDSLLSSINFLIPLPLGFWLADQFTIKWLLTPFAGIEAHALKLLNLLVIFLKFCSQLIAQVFKPIGSMLPNSPFSEIVTCSAQRACVRVGFDAV